MVDGCIMDDGKVRKECGSTGNLDILQVAIIAKSCVHDDLAHPHGH